MKTKPYLILCILIFGVVLISSCKKDKADDDPIVTDPRDEILGNYQTTDSMFMHSNFYSVKTYILLISKDDSDKDKIKLVNLWNDGGTYYAIGSGNFYSIPSQNVSGPYNMSGSISFDGNKVSYETSGDVYINKGNGTKQ
ncbi:MAG: hypothetical protein K9J13_16525 [Saprospiraceae bacterium]|nr:hypothetical protein [Saprospiraceae bacterium]